MATFLIIKVKILMLIKWSYNHPPSQKKKLNNKQKTPIMMSIELNVASIILWACGPILFKHMYL